MSLVSELKRRNVFKVAVAYAVVTWILIEISATVFPIFQLPEWTVTFVTMLLILGFPVAMLLTWAYELTPEGKKTMRKLFYSAGVKLAAIVATIAIVTSGPVSAQPQGPSCGTFTVLKDTKVETRLFPKGAYRIHAIGVSCEEVIGEDGLFAKFLGLGDGTPLPEPWESLIGAVGAPKFAAGPGVGFRAQRISD